VRYRDHGSVSIVLVVGSHPLRAALAHQADQATTNQNLI
jgi:hypothetical protein